MNLVLSKMYNDDDDLFYIIGHFHCGVILLQLPESFSFLFS